MAVTHPTPDSTRVEMLRGWLWSALAMLGAVIATVLVALLFYPWDDTSGWAGLGWFIYTLGAAAVVGLITGTSVFWWQLVERQVPHPGQTALVFVPVALLLGAVSAGVGALLAPPVAWWLVRGLHRPATPEAAVAAYGVTPPPTRGRLVATGAWQRALISAVVVWLGLVWLIDELASRWGGEVNGPALVWAATLPLAVGVPALLVGRRSWAVTAALAVAGAALAVPITLDETRYAHPSTERVERDVSRVGLPAGTTRQQFLVTEVVETDATYSVPYDLPVVVVGADAELVGDLEPWTSTIAASLPAPSPRGREVAEQWAEDFREAGWEDNPGSDAYVLPHSLQEPLERGGTVHLTQGTWVRTFIYPAGDGAVAVTIARR
jgi:hypothetical protein